jgi:phosphoribosyl-ATP pyrophosphohydrolase/phosphoribosyl-AMP cyclohydrolase/histidinol dehydrogenase
MLKQLSVEEALRLDLTSALDDILPQAQKIVQDVRIGKDAALRNFSERFGDITPSQPLIIERAGLLQALNSMSQQNRAMLERTADRIRRFAEAQRAALSDLSCAVDGGFAGHTVLPLERAACYAPGGRYPLPSSVLMTAVTARVAGVREVWVASPKPSIPTLAAAAIAGADALLTVGGAHAIAAMAFGTETIPKFDIIVGPGNRWVTAAKQIVAGFVKIDMLAGPSELAICADGSANPALVAADLLAQAEHDPDARVILISLDLSLIAKVKIEIELQLAELSTRKTASESIRKSICVMVDDLEHMALVCNALAPEHLSLQLNRNAMESIRPLLRNYGGLFIGAGSAEVLGDYGIGPNHVLPTQATARVRGGLAVFDFLKIQTWLDVSNPSTLLSNDIQTLAQLEGLEGHARSMGIRSNKISSSELGL